MGLQPQARNHTCHKNLFTSEVSKCYQNVILTMTVFVLNALSPGVHLKLCVNVQITQDRFKTYIPRTKAATKLLCNAFG